MASFQLVLALIAAFSVLMSICLFGSLPQLQDTWLSRLRQILLRVPTALLTLLDPKGTWAQSVVRFWSRNVSTIAYIVPLGYLVVVTVSVHVFYADCMPLLAPVHHIWVPVVCVLPYIASALAVLSDPGRISKTNHARIMANFRFDKIIFMPGYSCRTCKFEKPARSKHCSSCDCCVANADHHCVWINNCVGHYNYRWFLLYVLSNSIILTYGFCLTWSILHLEVLNTDAHIPPSFLNWHKWIYVVRSTVPNRHTGCLMLLCGLLAPVAIGFLLVHVKFIYLGTTTNESAKWDGINECIQDDCLFVYTYDDPKLCAESLHNDEPMIVLQKLADGSWHRGLTSAEQQWIQQRHLVPKQVRGFQDIKNIYDSGFWGNLTSRLFPKPL